MDKSRRITNGIRLLGNDALLWNIERLLTSPASRPANALVVWYASFLYQAQSWDRARRVVTKAESHGGIVDQDLKILINVGM